MCWFLARALVVGPDGVVTPCCQPTGMVFGNLLDDEIESVWNAPLARDLRRGHADRSAPAVCARCLHAPYLRRIVETGSEATGATWSHVHSTG